MTVMWLYTCKVSLPSHEGSGLKLLAVWELGISLSVSPRMRGVD